MKRREILKEELKNITTGAVCEMLTGEPGDRLILFTHPEDVPREAMLILREVADAIQDACNLPVILMSDAFGLEVVNIIDKPT